MKLRRVLIHAFWSQLRLRSTAFALDPPQPKPEVMRPDRHRESASGTARSPKTKKRAQVDQETAERSAFAFRTLSRAAPVPPRVPSRSSLSMRTPAKSCTKKTPTNCAPPASTQKLLTALIVAERGFLDQPREGRASRYDGRAGEAEHQGGRHSISASICCARCS